MKVILIPRSQPAEVVEVNADRFIPGETIRFLGKQRVLLGEAPPDVHVAVFGTQRMFDCEYPIAVEAGVNPRHIPPVILAVLTDAAGIGRPDRGRRAWT